MEDNLHLANLAIEGLRKNCGDLQKEKDISLREIAEATERKDVEIESLNIELSE